MDDNPFFEGLEVLNYEDDSWEVTGSMQQPLEKASDFWGKGVGGCRQDGDGDDEMVREIRYQRWVLVMWRRNDTFHIKCIVNLHRELLHILDTCQEGDLVRAKQELEQFFSYSEIKC